MDYIKNLNEIVGYIHGDSLINADCLEAMKLIEDKSIDCIICDLPYGTTACKWDTIIPFDKLWEQYNRIIKDNGAICLFGSEPFSSMLRMSNLKMYKYDWIWEKNTISGFALAKKQPLRNHENISVFYKKQPIYNPIFQERDLNEDSKKRMNYDFTSTKGKNQVQGIDKVQFVPLYKDKSYPKTVQKFVTIPNNSNKRIHPTQKPIALIEYLINTYSNDGDLILDNTAGSMTTAIAAINTNRRCICIEKDDHYFEIGSERVRKHLQDLNNK